MTVGELKTRLDDTAIKDEHLVVLGIWCDYEELVAEASFASVVRDYFPDEHGRKDADQDEGEYVLIRATLMPDWGLDA